MFRILITYLLPLFGPLALYLAWNAYAKHKARKTGQPVPSIEKGPVFWSLVTGFALLIVALVALALTTGEEPGQGTYQSPRLEDGRVVPPGFRKE